MFIMRFVLIFIRSILIFFKSSFISSTWRFDRGIKILLLIGRFVNIVLIFLTLIIVRVLLRLIISHLHWIIRNHIVILILIRFWISFLLLVLTISISIPLLLHMHLILVGIIHPRGIHYHLRILLLFLLISSLDMRGRIWTILNKP